MTNYETALVLCQIGTALAFVGVFYSIWIYLIKEPKNRWKK